MRNLHKIPIILSFIITSCGSTDNNEPLVDISIKYNNIISSYKIDENGEAMVFYQENRRPNVYKVKFSEENFKILKGKISKFDFQCDSVKSITVDGLQYTGIIKKGDREVFVQSYTCKQSEQVEEIVEFIIKTFNESNKEEYFRTLSSMVPPSLSEK